MLFLWGQSVRNSQHKLIFSTLKVKKMSLLTSRSVVFSERARLAVPHFLSLFKSSRVPFSPWSCLLNRRPHRVLSALFCVQTTWIRNLPILSFMVTDKGLPRVVDSLEPFWVKWRSSLFLERPQCPGGALIRSASPAVTRGLGGHALPGSRVYLELEMGRFDIQRADSSWITKKWGTIIGL